MTRIIILALYLLPAVSLADVLLGRVVRVSDGDTIVVLDAAKVQHKIRLNGIDAPEKKQAFGEASRKNLAALVADKSVTVEWSKRDRYGRVIGKVRTNAEDVGLRQIRDGMAWHYVAYVKDQRPEDRAIYADSEKNARSSRVGLWQDKQVQAPWEWRREKH